MMKKAKTATIPDHFNSQTLPVFLLACLSVFLILSTLSHGRERAKSTDYALIFGTVWSPDDRPLAGVKVKIKRAGEKKTRWEVYSSRRGEFVQWVPVGKQEYIVWADTKGYKYPNGRHLQPGH